MKTSLKADVASSLKILIFNFLLHKRSSGFMRTKIARIVEYGLEEIALSLLDDFGWAISESLDETIS